MLECQKVKELLPLWIGQDLADTTAAGDVERHLKGCANCDQHRKGLQSSLDVLQGLSSGTLSTEGQHQSLWPKISDRIALVSPSQRSTGNSQRFSGWIPASVMMVAVAVMITVSLPSIQDELFDSQARTSRSDLFNSPNANLQIDVNQSIKNPGMQDGESVGTPVKLEHKRDKKEDKK